MGSDFPPHDMLSALCGTHVGTGVVRRVLPARSPVMVPLPSGRELQLSVVIPSYNSARWLPSTLEALAAAVRAAGLGVEVVIIDDGSVDDTAAVVAELGRGFPGEVTLVTQENRGRFLARWEGLDRARAEYVLLLDSRVLLDEGALSHVFARMGDRSAPAPAAWNAHVRTDASVPLVGLFWDVPTHIFWGDYLRAPRPFDLTPETFDRAPKGTGVFLARRETLRAAFLQAWPTGDAKLVSDDTKVLRWIAGQGGIRLDPGFSAVYRPRTTLRGFIRHTFDRGTLFVDSYAGTSLLRSAVILAGVAAPVIVIAVAIALLATGSWLAAVILVGAVIVACLLPVVPAAMNRCPPRSILAYVCCLPAFLLPFWGGLVRGAVLHRRAFSARERAGRPIPGKDPA